jgi:hypothetical protein
MTDDDCMTARKFTDYLTRGVSIGGQAFTEIWERSREKTGKAFRNADGSQAVTRGWDSRTLFVIARSRSGETPAEPANLAKHNAGLARPNSEVSMRSIIFSFRLSLNN